MSDHLYIRFVCDTCGHKCEDSEWDTWEEFDALGGTPCARPWCTGHYKLVNLEPYYTLEKGWPATLREAIRAEFFPLPTFDREAYKEECLLVQKQEAEKEAYRKAHPIPHCPKCGSSSLHKKRRGFKVGRALMGGFLAGSIRADDLVYKCETCGCEWKP